MVDQDKTGLPAETDEVTPAQPDTNKPAGDPDADPADAKPVSDPEAKPPDGEPAKPSVPDVPLETLLEREDIKRWGQSIGDRAAARAESRFKELADKRERDAKAATDRTEREKLIKEENFDELGRREAVKSEAEERLLESLELAGNVISRAAIARYAQELGEETVDRIVSEVGARNGDVVELTTALAEESTKRAVQSATGIAVEDAEKRFEEKLDAKLADAGVAKRSEDVKTTGPVEKVSGTPAEVAGSEEEPTYESESEAYGRGDRSWDEFKPFKDAHDAERLKH